MPDKGVRRIEIDGGGGLGREPVKSVGDPLEGGEKGLGIRGHGGFRAFAGAYSSMAAKAQG